MKENELFTRAGTQRRLGLVSKEQQMAVPTFSELGADFNDATRALAGGLWTNTNGEGNQGLGSEARYVNDLTNVQNGLLAEIQAGQFQNDTANVNTILNDITTAINAANGGVADEAALRTAHLDILSVVNGDQNLAGQANGGFLAAPAELGAAPAFNPNATFADVGNIFNDLANKSLGGFNADNKDAAFNDVNVMIQDLQHLLQTDPQDFQNLTGIHAQTILNQLTLEKDYINDSANGTNALIGARGSNDNILDIIDIVQGDGNLLALAQNGFTPFGDPLHPTTPYQDNLSQTQFWANFIAQSNSLGQQGVTDVASGNEQAIKSLIGELQQFATSVTNFDAAQGGIFEGRFDNELLGDKSTLGAEINAMIKGLQTHNADLVNAAATEMHANAADVGGNNVPMGGGTYNGDGVTVADALSTATNPPQVQAQIPAVQAPATAHEAPHFEQHFADLAQHFQHFHHFG
jgi:hypothetical protein